MEAASARKSHSRILCYEEMTENGCIGDATKASQEIGEQIVEEIN